MTIKRKSFSDDFNKSFNLYTISASDINPDIPEEDSDYLYLIVPKQYKCVYKQLLIKLSQLGVDILNDCSAVCGGQNKHIITCWNMFQAAIAAYELGETKKADLIINYIKAQLNINCNVEETSNTNIIRLGNVDGGIFDFVENNDSWFINNATEELVVKGSSINTLEFNQTKSIHYLLIPTSKVDVIKISYISSGLESVLYNKQDNTINYTYTKDITYNGEKYKLFANFVISGSLDSNIVIQVKNN